MNEMLQDSKLLEKLGPGLYYVCEDGSIVRVDSVMQALKYMGMEIPVTEREEVTVRT